jgi:hypothetical protein
VAGRESILRTFSSRNRSPFAIATVKEDEKKAVTSGKYQQEPESRKRLREH